MATNIYQERLIKRRKERGLCIKCGEPLDREGVHCIKCREILNKSRNETKQWYKDNGICPRCGQNNLFGDEKVCIECNAIAYAYNIQRANRLGREYCNQKQAEYHKIRYHKNSEQGICTRCGKRNADYGYKTCGICRAKDRKRKRAKYGKPERSERYKQGLCYFCDNPVKEGYKVCEKHYQMNIEKANSNKAKDARKELIDNKILY